MPNELSGECVQCEDKYSHALNKNSIESVTMHLIL